MDIMILAVHWIYALMDYYQGISNNIFCKWHFSFFIHTDH